SQACGQAATRAAEQAHRAPFRRVAEFHHSCVARDQDAALHQGVFEETRRVRTEAQKRSATTHETTPLLTLRARSPLERRRTASVGTAFPRDQLSKAQPAGAARRAEAARLQKQERLQVSPRPQALQAEPPGRPRRASARANSSAAKGRASTAP